MIEFAPHVGPGENLLRNEDGWVWVCPCGFEATCLEDVGGHRQFDCTPKPAAPPDHEAQLVGKLDSARHQLDSAWSNLRIPLTGDDWTEAERLVNELLQLIQRKRSQYPSLAELAKRRAQ